MIPEISHRCPACGASLHQFGERTMFCPECGKRLAKPEPPASPAKDTSSEIDEQSSVSAETAPSSAVNIHSDLAVAALPAESDAAVKDTAPDKIRHGARERTRETLHRASNVARGAIEDNVKRVEKIHHVSSVMFEEATYDPSLRFVLVALGLFIVFVILLVLSKVMG